tara:strand:- start:515 stop:1600 length:1086 start_codon:yes stop_codon:yes gene_type:complete
MDFHLTEDRRMLSDTLNRYLGDQYGLEHRNSVAYEAPYYDSVKWQELAELGVFAALATEKDGGFGGAGGDISVVFEALGKALVCEPVLPVLMASRLLSAAGKDQSGLLDGSIKYGFALSEPDAPYDISDITTSADAFHKVTGRKSAVYGAHLADRILVAARREGQINLYEVMKTDAEIISYGMIDGGGAGEVLLDKSSADLILQNAAAAVKDAMNAGVVALCSEAIGAMETAYEMTVDYLKQRKQFGRTIGSFQVLQHRAVDMLTEIEQARSITIKAAAELGGPDASRFAAMAKNMIGRAGRQIAEEAIQLHGGIAMTWEYGVSHYAKRIIMIDHQLGDTDYHLARIMSDLSASQVDKGSV